MKVLLTCHFPLTGSGSGVYTMNVANALAKRGHEICIIIPENQLVDDYDAFRVHPVYFNGITDDALDFDFPCFTTHPRSVQTFYELTEDQLDEYEKAFRSAIEEEIRLFEPDVIHCGHAWLQPSYVADYDIPYIVTVHGTDLLGYQESERFRGAAAKALECAKAIVTISKENDARVRELFPSQADKCHLILNGYNADVFYPEPTSREEALALFGIEGDFDKLVSFAGKFAGFKGIDVLLKGAASYTEPGIATVLAGDGELFAQMEELRGELGLDENVFFVHNQPHDVLRRLYSAADVSLLTSRKEPFGLVIIEAMACGAPVVGSDDGGAVDIVNEDCGLLFESENPQDLSRQVKRILEGEVSFDREAIAQQAKSRFSQDESIHLLEELYRAP